MSFAALSYLMRAGAGEFDPPPAARPFRFYLGTDKPAWLARPEFAGVPLFVSYSRLGKRKALPRAVCPWGLDSSGFSALRGGGYAPAARYAADVRRYRDEIGGLEWAAVQDWMCEPDLLAKTGLGVAGHQRRTVESYRELTALAPDLPWAPVLQGWGADDYHRHADAYASAGVELARLPVVGLGSVCRRQGMAGAAVIVKSLYARGLRNVHGFGFKLTGLVSKGLRLCRYLAGSDSMAWSFRARKAWRHGRRHLCGGRHRGSCAHCTAWPLAWRAALVGRVELVARGGVQGLMF